MNELEIKSFLGKRIKDLRIKKGLTQEKLAELIDVGERNLSKIECGQVFVKSSTIAKLINALEVEPKELFDFTSLQPNTSLKNTLVNAINNDMVDVDLLYRIYRSIKY